jgi:O-acetyl-ADP-ribose deacetylase (regulator of RNase III)
MILPPFSWFTLIIASEMGLIAKMGGFRTFSHRVDACSERKYNQPQNTRRKREAMNTVLREFQLPGGGCIQIVQGDLTQESVDAIVNAANACLQHGGGVAGAILRRGGPEIQAESNAWVQQHGPVTHEQPAYTGAGRLPCRYVIHAVGPVWGEGDEDQKLAKAVGGSLALAESLELKSLALPAISTGIFGFPKERAARIILNSAREYLSSTLHSHLELVRMTLYDQPTLDAFLQVWASLGLEADL